MRSRLFPALLAVLLLASATQHEAPDEDAQDDLSPAAGARNADAGMDAPARCRPGCRVDLDCPPGDAGPGLCDVTTHRCVGCRSDATCPLGTVCIAGSCTPGCSVTHGCPSGQGCCGGTCTDITSDPTHCG